MPTGDQSLDDVHMCDTHTVLLISPLYSSLSWLMILPQVHLRKPCYDFYFL